jgi:hypothetical protein
MTGVGAYREDMTYPKVQAGLYAAAGIAGIVYAAQTNDGTDIAIGAVWSASCVVGIVMEVRAIRLGKNQPDVTDPSPDQHRAKRRRPSRIGQDKPLVHGGKGPPHQG